MKIESISLHPIQIPLRVKFSQSNNSTSLSNSMILSVQTTDGIIGHGESCPRLYVTGENIESVTQEIEQIEKELLTKTFDSLPSLQNWICHDLPSRIGLASICALELALLDAWFKRHGTMGIKYLQGNTTRPLTYSGVVPLAKVQALTNILNLTKKLGLKDIKLKVNQDVDDTVYKVHLIKKVLGPDINIRFDANCSWNYDQAKKDIPVYLDLGIDSFEQMFLPGMDDNMQKITQQFGNRARIMADESVTTYSSAMRLISSESCNHLNLKISKHGGIFNTLRIYELAKTHNISCQLGAHFGETSILTAAGILVASLAPDLTALEGAYGHHLLTRDICTHPLGFDTQGQISDIEQKLSPTGLGFGEVDRLPMIL